MATRDRKPETMGKKVVFFKTYKALFYYTDIYIDGVYNEKSI